MAQDVLTKASGLPSPRPLFKIAKLDVDHTAGVFQKLLSREYEKWSEKKREWPSFSTVRPLSPPPLTHITVPLSWPVQVALFRLTGHLFSVSGSFSTALLRVMTQILAQVGMQVEYSPMKIPSLSPLQSQVKSLLDLLLGLLLCDTVMEVRRVGRFSLLTPLPPPSLQFVGDSKKYVPELVNYLSSCVGCFSKGDQCKYPLPSGCHVTVT